MFIFFLNCYYKFKIIKKKISLYFPQLKFIFFSKANLFLFQILEAHHNVGILANYYNFKIKKINVVHYFLLKKKKKTK